MPGAQPHSDPPQRGPIWSAKLPPWIFAAALFLGILWIPAGLVGLLIPDTYLPSCEWLSISRPTAYLLLGTSCVLTFLFATRVSKHRDANAYVDGMIVAAFIGALSFVFVADLFHRIVPAVMAKMFGGEVEHSYKVIRADRPSDKWCRTPVDLEGMPFMSTLCGTGEGFRSHLSPGQTVVFGGTGTWMGLYVEYIQP